MPLHSERHPPMRANGRAHILDAEEPVARPCQNPALNQQDRIFDFCFILWSVHPRRNHGRVVMRGEIPLGPVDRRVVEARPGDPGLQGVRCPAVVSLPTMRGGHDLSRHSPEKAGCTTCLAIQSGSDRVQVAAAKV